MKKKKDPRHIARVIVLQHLFEKVFELENIKIQRHSTTELININKIESVDQRLIKKLIDCINKHKEEANKIIKNFAPKYPIENMDKINYLILQIAICEGFISQITPTKVAIDEAVELAKEFGSQDSYKFINGVLGKIYEESKRNKNKEV